MARGGAGKEVAAACREVVLVCRKCSRKLDGGFGRDGDEPLAKALRRSLDREAGRKLEPRRSAVAVLEVGCLDVCPKGAVMAILASDPGRWRLIPKGTPLPEVARRLGLMPQGAPTDPAKREDVLPT